MKFDGLNNHIKNVGLSSFHTRNSIGLDNAYKAKDKLHIEGDTLFIAGTSNFRDVVDDIRLPFHDTKRTKRFQDADALLSKNPHVKHLVSHSLGSAVGHELEHGKKFESNVSYGAPLFRTIFDKKPDENHPRFRGKFDIVSIFDYGATTIQKEGVGLFNSLDAHAYNNFN